jgi:thiol-disulfide isomerase/thioredoxin
LWTITAVYAQNPEPKTLPIGSKAPDFRLKGVDSKMYSLKSFSKAEILVIIFSAPHCPTAQAYEERIKDIRKDYIARGVQVVMINPNNPMAVCLEELGYSEMGDSFSEMQQRARDQAFNFPFLDDGAEQKTAQLYGPVATPHVFIFDKERVLRYSGRIDNGEKIGSATQHDTRNAIEALLAGKEVPLKETKVFGCSVKWKWKNEYRKKLDQEWSQKQVKLEKITLEGLNGLLKNDSKKLRVINFWATWCGPCVEEMHILQQIYQEWSNKGLIIMGINEGDPVNKVTGFIQRYGIAFPVLMDDDQEVAHLFSVRYMPTSVLLDKDGVIQVVAFGGFDTKEQFVSKMLSKVGK